MEKIKEIYTKTENFIDEHLLEIVVIPYLVTITLILILNGCNMNMETVFYFYKLCFQTLSFKSDGLSGILWFIKGILNIAYYN